MRGLSIVALSIALVTLDTAVAQVAPTTGTVTNTTENHSLTYDCSQPRQGELVCEFVQVIVRHKATQADLDRSLEQTDELIRQMRSDPSQFAETCNLFSQIRTALNNPSATLAAPPPGLDIERFQQGMARLGEHDTADVLQSANNFLAFCAEPNRETAEAVIRFTHSIDARTCLVSSLRFTQTFRPVGGLGGESAWIALSSPGGMCGVVQLDRFERDGSDFLWNYIARKAVTNPNGAPPGFGLQCSALDEATYTYSWRHSSRYLGCDYVDFSMF